MVLNQTRYKLHAQDECWKENIVLILTNQWEYIDYNKYVLNPGQLVKFNQICFKV